MIDSCSLVSQFSLFSLKDHPHPRLWKLLAETALEQFNFNVADKAFVRCADFYGIQFVKRLKLITDRNKQKAELSTYFLRFEEAESLYVNMDAKDLALQLRSSLGDWARVVQLIQQTGVGDDKLLNEAFDNIGYYYSDRLKWCVPTWLMCWLLELKHVGQ